MNESSMAQPDPLIGLRIHGSYVIREKLAEGGMGCVYVCVNDLEQKLVAKFLLGEFANNPMVRERFDREARAAARVNSPHIVKILDIGALPDGKQFMIMEFLHGKSLENHMRQVGRLDPYQCLRIISQIVHGLWELHRAGVIHRDLKPSNVFLVRDGNDYVVKLIDLGIAHDSMAFASAGFKTQTGVGIGTPGYMPPEQLAEAGSVTVASDLYAVGVMLWEMLTGSLPWVFDNTPEYYFRQRTETPVFPGNVRIPEGWLEILLATLSPSPAQRPRSLYVFLNGLGRSLPPMQNEQSGVEILARHARPVIQDAPVDGETVRAPNAERVAAILFTPQRLTHVPRREPVPATPRHVSTPVQPPTVNARYAAPASAPPSVLTPTSNERPPAATPPVEERRTTLSSAVGVAGGQAPGGVKTPSRAPAIAAIGVALAVIGGGAFVIVRRHAPQPTSTQLSGAPAIDAAQAVTPAGSATTSPIVPAAAQPATTPSSPTSTGSDAMTKTERERGGSAIAPTPHVQRGQTSPVVTSPATSAPHAPSRAAGASVSRGATPSLAGHAAKTTKPASASTPRSGSAAPPSGTFDPDAVME